MKTHLRKIKTYVHRQSRMTAGQHFALENFWEYYGLEVQQGVVNFEKIFNRAAPRILEIGFGMGDSLLAMAKTQPAFDFIGIEVHRPGIGALLARLEKEAIHNVRVYNADAREVLINCIPDDSLNYILIFFPDPWPKRRHHKRRLIQIEFVKLLGSKLKSAGILHLATDWEDYAMQMMKVISLAPELKNINNDEKFADRLLFRNFTKFERRGQKLGHKISDLVFIKKENNQ